MELHLLLLLKIGYLVEPQNEAFDILPNQFITRFQIISIIVLSIFTEKVEINDRLVAIGSTSIRLAIQLYEI